MRPLLIIGSAPCLEQDLAKIEPGEFDVMACNGAGANYLGMIKYWATLHPSELKNWKLARRMAGADMDFTTLAPWPRPEVDTVFLGQPIPPGSTALLAVNYGLRLKYERIVLAGCPLNDPAYHRYQIGWVMAASALCGKVESLSGWTKTFLEGLCAPEK